MLDHSGKRKSLNGWCRKKQTKKAYPQCVPTSCATGRWNLTGARFKTFQPEDKPRKMNQPAPKLHLLQTQHGKWWKTIALSTRRALSDGARWHLGAQSCRAGWRPSGWRWKGGGAFNGLGDACKTLLEAHRRPLPVVLPWAGLPRQQSGGLTDCREGGLPHVACHQPTHTTSYWTDVQGLGTNTLCSNKQRLLFKRSNLCPGEISWSAGVFNVKWGLTSNNLSTHSCMKNTQLINSCSF